MSSPAAVLVAQKILSTLWEQIADIALFFYSVIVYGYICESSLEEGCM